MSVILGKRRGRVGRPPLGNAGEVDVRLLDAATHLFMEHGFAGTSCDQVAAKAGAGKASLYARYANKEALYEAVVKRCADQLPQVIEQDWTGLPTASDRLRHLAAKLIPQSIDPKVIAIVRMVISTVPHFPELALRVDSLMTNAMVQATADALLGHGNHSRRKVGKARATAIRFISATISPLQLRALWGDSQHELTKEASKLIEDAIAMLIHARRLKEIDV